MKRTNGVAVSMVVAAGAAAAVLGAATPARAETVVVVGDQPTTDGRADIAVNTGIQFAATPELYFPARGDTNGAVDLHLTYGLPVAPFVVAPGARFAAYFGPDGALSGMPILQIELPAGMLAPYVEGGLGIGHAQGPNLNGMAGEVAAGLVVHLTRSVELGGRVSYEAITDTPFRSFALGPTLAFR